MGKSGLPMSSHGYYMALKHYSSNRKILIAKKNSKENVLNKSKETLIKTSNSACLALLGILPIKDILNKNLHGEERAGCFA